MTKKRSDFRPRLKGNIKTAYNHLIKDEERILVIGDLHEPFCLDGYLNYQSGIKHSLLQMCVLETTTGL